MLREIRAACNLLPDVRLEVVRREANAVAHNLAMLARERQECVVLRFDHPESVCRLVEKEAPAGATSESGGSSVMFTPGVCNSVHAS